MSGIEDHSEPAPTRAPDKATHPIVNPGPKRKSLILYIRLHIPPVGIDTTLVGKSWLLISATKIKDLEIYGFADPARMKHPSMGRVFSEILPRNTNEFTLELGVILPDLFANIDGQPEFTVDVMKDGRKHSLCVSNRMAKLRFSVDDEQWHVIIPRTTPQPKSAPVEEKLETAKLAEEGLKEASGKIDRMQQILKETFAIPEKVHTEFLRTMVTTQFTIHGTDAEDALSVELDDRLSDFIALINQFAVSNLMVESEQPGITTPIYDRNTFDAIYVMVQGQDPNAIGVGRLGLNIPKLQLNPGAYSAEQSAKVRAYLDGAVKVDEAKRFLASAKSYLDGGLLPVALLHLSIAAEMATTRFVHSRLLEAGVSRNKLTEAGDQLTFSKMLNIDLFVVCPEGKKPDRQLVGKINEIRTMRNDLMHEGLFLADGTKLRGLYAAAKDFLGFLETLSAQVKP